MSARRLNLIRQSSWPILLADTVHGYMHSRDDFVADTRLQCYRW